MQSPLPVAPRTPPRTKQAALRAEATVVPVPLPVAESVAAWRLGPQAPTSLVIARNLLLAEAEGKVSDLLADAAPAHERERVDHVVVVADAHQVRRHHVADRHRARIAFGRHRTK